jgi:RHS repeat-associated protein
MALINNVSGAQFGALNSFINNSFNNIDLSKPQAFIVYMTFDKEMNLDPMNSGVVQVEHAYEIKYAKSREERNGIITANALGQLSRTAIAPRKDGYFYTYVTNRSAGKVHFDNMVIKRWAPQVRITYDYYPYGLTWEDPKLPSSPESIHDHCYQDKEFQWAEFTTGHGLALHDFHVTKRLVAAQRRLSDSNPAAQRCGARMYDGATGRWLVPDPAAQFANPYLAMGNNPVVSMDPDGRFIFTAATLIAAPFTGGASLSLLPMAIGADVGMWQGGSMANGSMDPTDWEFDSNTFKYMAAGAVVGLLRIFTPRITHMVFGCPLNHLKSLASAV